MSAILLMTLLSSGAFFMTFPDAATGAVLYVGPTSTHPTIASALENATSGDTIFIASGKYPERFDITLNMLTVRGNATDQVIIEPPSGAPSGILAPFVTLSGMTFKNHTLHLSSNNITLRSLFFDIRKGVAILAEKADTLTCSDLNMNGSPDVGIHVANSTMVRLGQVRPAGTERMVISAYQVRSLTIEGMVWDLTGIGTGARILGKDAVMVDSRIYSSSNATGIDFIGDGLYVHNTTFSVAGTGVNATGNIIQILGSGVKALYPGDIGLRLSKAGNVSINGTSFAIRSSGLGIECSSVADMALIDSSIDMTGISSRFMVGYGLVKTEFKDIIASAKGDGQRLISIGHMNPSKWGSDRLSIENSSFFMEGEGSTLLVLNDSIRPIISRNLFTISGNGSACINGSGPGFVLEHNSFSLNRGSSIGAALDSSNYTVKDQVFVQYGIGSKGIVMDGADGLVSDSSFVTFSSGDSVVLTGSRNELSGCFFYANGDGRGLTSSGSVDCLVNNTSFALIGKGSEGLTAVDSTNLTIDNVLIDAKAGAGAPVRSIDSEFKMRDASMVHNSTVSVLNLTGGSMLLERIWADSAAVALSAQDVDLTARDCFVSGMRLASSAAYIAGSDLWSGMTDLHAVYGSSVRLIDSEAATVIADATSVVRVSSTLVIKAIDGRDRPLSGVDVLVSNDRGSIIYNTSAFGGTDPRTDDEGMTMPFIALDRIYGIGAGGVSTTARLATDGTAASWDESYDVEAKEPGTIALVVGDIDLPRTPMNIRVRALSTAQSLLVQWDTNDDDTISYRIYLQEGEQWVQIGTVDHPTSSWTSSDLGPAFRGLFRVTSFDGTWESAPSETSENITLDLTPPTTPGLTLDSRSSGSMNVEWTSGSEPDLAGFAVEMNSTASMTQFRVVLVAGPSEMSATITGLSPGTTYGFRARAFDLSDNHSPYSALIKAATMPRLFTIQAVVIYDGGPLDASAALSSVVRLVNFNGTLLDTSVADLDGTAVFVNLSSDESYRLEASPEASMKGIEGVLTGYLENASGFIETTGDLTRIVVVLTLPYYLKPAYGSISVSVEYGDGDRDGPVYNALVELLDSTNSTVESRSTDDLGTASFLIRALPFKGSFRVVPPSSVAAIPGKRAGYLEGTSAAFNLTVSYPDGGTIHVKLEYMSFHLPPRPLTVVWRSPTGLVLDLDEPIVVTFNQALRTSSVEGNTSISPLVKGVDYVWSNNNHTVTIVHDGLDPDTIYRVTLGRSIVSEDGTTFPVGYANNTWEFKTSDDSAAADTSRILIYASLALISLILIALVVFVYLKQPRRNDLEIEEDEPDPYSYDDPEEEIVDGPMEDLDAEVVEDDATEFEDIVEAEGVSDDEGPQDEEREVDGDIIDEDVIEMLEDDDDFGEDFHPEEAKPLPKPRIRVLKGA
jgi:hypothetical protein